jgi:uncharacterized delta-60 repeat protein
MPPKFFSLFVDAIELIRSPAKQTLIPVMIRETINRERITMKLVRVLTALLGFLFVSVSTAFGQASFLDQTFGTNGKAVTFIAGGDSDDDGGHAVAMQTDGKIVVAGSSVDTNGQEAFAVARYNPDGSLDNTFGTGGTARVNIAGGDSDLDEAYAIAIQPDGKILVAGQSQDTSNGEAHMRFALARFNSNGTLDNSFGPGGTVRAPITGGGLVDFATSVALLPNGEILVGGFSDSTYSASGLTIAIGPTMGVARFNADGSIDKTFGNSGSVEVHAIGFPLPLDLYSIAVQSDGKIVCAGASTVNETTGQIAFTVARLDSNGALDNSFGSGGSAYTFIAGGDSTEDIGYSVAIQSNGKIVVGGYTNGGTSADPRVAIGVARFDSDGVLDNSFGSNGTVSTYVNGPDSLYPNGYSWDAYGYSVALQSDGKIVVSGSTSNGFAVVRFDTNGTLDNIFGANGTAVADSFSTDGDIGDFGWSVAIQSDGRLVVAGSAQASFGPTAFAVARLLSSNVTGIREANSGPKQFALFQNYPNPFNPTTVISYKLSAVSNVTLKVYDVLGREVATLVNEKQHAGSYSVSFDGNRLASGVYFYRLSAGSFVSVKKLVLVK